MTHFKDKVAIITGAGSGIGKALAVQLSQKGAILVITELLQERLEQTKQELIEAGLAEERLAAHRLDVTDADAVAAVIRDIHARFKRIDFLFNNAGIAVGGEAQDLSLDDWRNVIDVNLSGVIHGVHAVYPLMIEQGSGHIINTASLAGINPMPLAISYTTTKHAVVGLSNALRIEGAALGVRVSVVCPGSIDTKIWHDSTIRGGYERDRLLKYAHIRTTAQHCAKRILNGVRRNKSIILVTAEARLFWYIYRLWPALSLFFYRLAVKKARKIRAET